MDEATASLDVENETKIQTAISELVRDKTVLIIAHRMRTIANADRIVVLKDGMVTDVGTSDELIRKDGYFKRMIELQMKKQKFWRITHHIHCSGHGHHDHVPDAINITV